jgi:ATP-dependent exoDNAse (exonuclease V) beta subunit
MAGLTEQQQQAVVSEAGRILVSAGAGSGKTHVLVERYIERLKRDAKLKINNFVAVTFTRKAANEMRIRLKKRIRELYDRSGGDERRRWSVCLADVDGAKIGTIHSLCEMIIKTFPLDAGVDPKLEVLDDLGQARLLEESINAAFREVIEAQSEEHELLLEFDMLQIRSWLTSVLRSSLQFQEAVADVARLSKQEMTEYANTVCSRARARAVKTFARSKSMRNAVADLRAFSSSGMTPALDQMRLNTVSFGEFLLNLDTEQSIGSINGDDIAWQALRMRRRRLAPPLSAFARRRPLCLRNFPAI